MRFRLTPARTRSLSLPKVTFVRLDTVPRQLTIVYEVQKLRVKSNSNWGKPCGDIPNTPTSFDEMVRGLNLSEKDYRGSIPLKEWAKKHKDSKYVPQELLDAWEIEAKL